MADASSSAESGRPDAIAVRAASTQSGCGRPVEASSRARRSTDGGRSIERETTRAPAVVVARLAELRPLVGHQVRVNGWDYAIWLLPDGSVRALDNSCAHVESPIVDGAVHEGCVICPWHGWRYVLATGQRRTSFGDLPGIGSFPVRVVDGDVVLELPPDRCR